MRERLIFSVLGSCGKFLNRPEEIGTLCYLVQTQNHTSPSVLCVLALYLFTMAVKVEMAMANLISSVAQIPASSCFFQPSEEPGDSFHPVKNITLDTQESEMLTSGAGAGGHFSSKETTSGSLLPTCILRLETRSQRCLCCPNPAATARRYLREGCSLNNCLNVASRVPVDSSVPLVKSFIYLPVYVLYFELVLALLAKPSGKLAHIVLSEGMKTNTKAGFCFGAVILKIIPHFRIETPL